MRGNVACNGKHSVASIFYESATTLYYIKAQKGEFVSVCVCVSVFKELHNKYIRSCERQHFLHTNGSISFAFWSINKAEHCVGRKMFFFYNEKFS